MQNPLHLGCDWINGALLVSVGPGASTLCTYVPCMYATNKIFRNTLLLLPVGTRNMHTYYRVLGAYRSWPFGHSGSNSKLCRPGMLDTILELFAVCSTRQVLKFSTSTSSVSILVIWLLCASHAGDMLPSKSYCTVRPCFHPSTSSIDRLDIEALWHMTRYLLSYGWSLVVQYNECMAGVTRRFQIEPHCHSTTE